MKTACSMPSCNILPNIMIATEIRYDENALQRWTDPELASNGSRQAWLTDVVVHQGSVDGRAVSAAAPFPAERPLSRTSPRIPGALRDAVSLGLHHAGNRSRSRAAKQVRLAARGRRDAGRDTVRPSSRQPVAGGDRGPGNRVTADRLADDADGVSEHARGRRPRSGKRRALRDPVGSLHRFDIRTADRGRGRHRVSPT